MFFVFFFVFFVKKTHLLPKEAIPTFQGIPVGDNPNKTSASEIFSEINSDNQDKSLHYKYVSSFVSVKDCSFFSYNGGTTGGSIFLSQCQLTSSFCSFKECSACAGGAVFLLCCDAVLNSINFTQCIAYQQGGGLSVGSIIEGAPPLADKYANVFLTLNKCRFESCVAREMSGGFECHDIDDVFIENTIVSNCFAGISAGGVGLFNSNAIITSSAFDGNECGNSSAIKLEQLKNHRSYRKTSLPKGGGAILVYSDTNRLFFTQLCCFHSNKCINTNKKVPNFPGFDILFFAGSNKNGGRNVEINYQSFEDRFVNNRKSSINNDNSVKMDLFESKFIDGASESKFLGIADRLVCPFEGFVKAYENYKSPEIWKATNVFPNIEVEKVDKIFEAIDNIEPDYGTNPPTEIGKDKTTPSRMPLPSDIIKNAKTPPTKYPATMPFTPSDTFLPKELTKSLSKKVTYSYSRSASHMISHSVSETVSHTLLGDHLIQSSLFMNMTTFTQIYIKVESYTYTEIILIHVPVEESKKQVLTSAMLIGIVCGVVAIVALIAFAVVFVIRRARRNASSRHPSSSLDEYVDETVTKQGITRTNEDDYNDITKDDDMWM